MALVEEQQREGVRLLPGGAGGAEHPHRGGGSVAGALAKPRADVLEAPRVAEEPGLRYEDLLEQLEHLLPAPPDLLDVLRERRAPEPAPPHW